MVDDCIKTDIYSRVRKRGKKGLTYEKYRQNDGKNRCALQKQRFYFSRQ